MKFCWYRGGALSNGDDDGDGAGAGVGSDRPMAASSVKSGGKGGSLIENLSEDGNLNMSNVTNVVVGRVGNLFGKGIGGLSSKLGGGGWF